MNHTLSDSQLEAMVKSAVNSFGPLPPDEKFSQLISALRELQERRNADSVTAAAYDVLAERQRQISSEGWSAEHDDEHAPGQLSDAGGCYALSAFEDDKMREGYEPDWWPWERHWYKPGTPRRDLVKAAALIIAEIEHLDRAGSVDDE
ncbi:hypothetical protein [Klebsiella michiganensis]|uniref:hypothetical protein n=1 Tax=Klebsiella michiganensis TaxID=1134687 RepID=UPI0007DACAEB|nr:hypothetical protein [Klebsiella michiganensis]